MMNALSAPVSFRQARIKFSARLRMAVKRLYLLTAIRAPQGLSEAYWCTNQLSV